MFSGKCGLLCSLNFESRQLLHLWLREKVKKEERESKEKKDARKSTKEQEQTTQWNKRKKNEWRGETESRSNPLIDQSQINRIILVSAHNI